MLVARWAMIHAVNPFMPETITAVASITLVGGLIVALSRVPLFVLEHS